MIKTKPTLCLILVLIGAGALLPRPAAAAGEPALPAAAAYLGQTPPGDTAVVFAPALVSTATQFAGNSSFSPDGREFYFSVTNSRWDAFDLMVTKFRNGAWTVPVKAGLLENKFTLEPFCSADGKRIYFNGGDAANMDLWYCERTGDGWGRAEKLPAAVDTPGMEWFPSLSRTGTLFYTRNGKIFYSLPRAGRYDTVASLGKPVNGAGNQTDGDPLIAPDESFLIFLSVDRAGGRGQGDLYISYKKADGNWTNPKNLGPEINSGEFECGPALTPDGKYFMFTRRKQWLTETPSQVYWIRADFIEKLRHTNFAPYADRAIPGQAGVAGQPLRFALPPDAFRDDDGDDTLTWSAALESGAALPAWLRFDPGTRTLSATATEAGTVKIRITATDPTGASAATIVTLAVSDASARAAQTVAPQFRGAYFGQPLPGESPVPFAPEILAAFSPWVEATDFSPDGNQFLMAVGDAGYSSAKLYHSQCVDGAWTPFVAAPFAADFTFAHEPHFSTNGTHLTFTGRKANGAQDIWILRYANGEWGAPAALPAPVNSEGKEWRGSTTANGVVYFGSEREKTGLNQIYKVYRGADQQLVAEKLGPPVNTGSYEGDPCVAPDGRFLLFYSARDGKSADLYVSFSDGQGGWGEPIRLGPEFNRADSDEYGAHLSADNKLLFFTRHAKQGNTIYWVAVSAIDKLKK